MNSSTVFVLWTFFSVTFSEIVLRNLDLEVTNGRTLYVRKTHLRFLTKPGEICKVQVVENEPIYQRVGELTPKVFDCDYLKRSVRYQHNGSPFLSKDVVKLRVSRLLVNETIQETLYLRIHILDSECDVIKKGGQELHVPKMNGVSNSITKNIIQFNYDRLFHTRCEIRIETKKYNFPAIGQLVIPKKSKGKEREYEAAGVIISDCDEFLLKGIRYQHLIPPTPDIDYIPLLVIITDKRSRYTLKQEQHWLPVRIEGAFPNQPPRPSFSNLNVLEVDQFVTTNLLSTAISATDSETDNDNLIFNVTKAPEKGFIAHLHDESKPVESFYQKDIANLNIAYQPPNISYSDRQTFTVEFVVFDSHNGVSRIIQVLLSIRVSHTTAPRISWNMGLTMLEGQSRTIDKNTLQIVDSDTLHLVRITLSGGLQHGRLYVNEKPGYSFSYTEIENNKVMYRHDDSETTRDYIMFQVSDGSHSTRFKLPIEVLPKDDSPPVLINNVVFEVEEGQTINIYSFMLEAYDEDSISDYVKYNITNPPKAGQIQKRKKGERAGWEVKKFEQRDLYQGDIYYKHMGDEAFDDSFDFVLIDNGKPYPNISPTQTVRIKITPVDDQPPKPVPEITRSLVINETDIAFITPQMLSYVDIENPQSEITYTITSEFETLDSFENGNSNQTDAGHLFYTDDMIMLMKDPSVPKLKMFSQHTVNHNKVAYMPPMDDIGLQPVDVHFEYSVNDEHGSIIKGEQFFVTVLPVDNQAPKLETKKIVVKEGGTVLISEDDIYIRDEDTMINHLKCIFVKPPKHGILEKYGRELSVGDTFSPMDIEDFGIMYTHNGFETLADSFDILVTDGHQNSTTAIFNIVIEPVDDERPVFSKSNALKVNESNSATVTSDHLRATDIDTDDKKLIFQIVKEPKSGKILLDHKESNFFTQSDILENRVQYQHDGEEIGHQPKYDVISFVVMDKDDNYGEHLETPSDHYDESPMETYDLNITIIPVNNRPPNIMLGSAIFHCDEGGRHVLTKDHLWADDLDTPEESLVFRISTPKFGVIEDNTPRKGYEKQISVPVTSFSLQRLLNGNIYYVQSEHRGIEPTADTFLVSVSDGKHDSAEVPFLIAIIPTNDEPPEVRVSNFSCSEGDMYSFSDAILDVVDLDIPSDDVMISVILPPTHGMLIDEMEMKRAKRSSKRSVDYAHLMHEMEHVSEFSLRAWSGHLIQPAYVHDGTENAHDRIQLKISDGKYAHQKEMSVNIVLVNDEKPEIVTNKRISVELGDTQVISNIELYSTDADTPNTELYYILHSIPNQGKLQKKSLDQWLSLQIGDSFTEDDVANNWIRYVHSNVFSTKERDSFRFAVTDGTWTTKRENFEITIKYKQKTTVHVVTGIAKVNEGDRVFITTDVLSARDGFDRPEDISYEIVSSSLFGQIEHISNSFTPIKLFSQMDLMSRKIIYRHQSKEDSALDSFIVRAGNGISYKEGIVTIQINPIDVELPTFSLFPFSPETGRDQAYLTVFRGSSVTINERILSITDPDTSKDHLRLIITSYPEHGSLTLAHEVLQSSGTQEITQIQLENAEFMYENNNDESLIDRFSFLVTDGAHSGYLVDGKLMKKPTIFNIRIEQLDDTPPRVTVNIPTTSIEVFGDSSSQYAVYIDSHNLAAVDDGGTLDEQNEIAFSVTEPPLYGMLKKVNENRKAVVVSEFTMADLQGRKLVYVIDGKLNVTEDKFVLDVQDAWGNVLMGNEFSMRWTRIELQEKSLTTCESDDSSTITIKRYGDLSISSFISVKTITLNSAKENHDFIPSTGKQIQFDPGSTSQTWIFKVPNDGIRERKEKFKLLLHSPINTVLESKHKEAAVFILDNGSRNCKSSSKTLPSADKSVTTNLKFARRTPKRKTKLPKKKKKKRKMKRKKSKRQKNLKLVKDQSAFPKPRSSSKTRKYGKLGKGVTVPSSNYFRNETHRKWTYHGLIPITIDEETVKEERPRLEGFGPSTEFNIPDDELINDEPHKEKITDKDFDIRNSKPEFRATNHDIPLPPDRPSSTRMTNPKKCTVYTYDRLYYDPIVRSLMRCSSAGWVPWSPSKAKASASVKVTDCDEGWHRFESRCFYIFSGDSASESWNTAQRRCREDFRAQLGTISNKKHMNWLRRKSGRQKMWIGLNKKLSSNWEWAGGDKVSFTNWKGGYKRHISKPGRSRHHNEADCAMITERKKWVAKNCSIMQNDTGFVCMKEMLL